MSSLKCPYCWRDIRASRLLRRCPDECTNAGGFFAGSKPRCPHGKEPRSARYCTHCNKRLEHDYVSTPGRVIATVGSSESGKSTYVGVLINELRGRLSDPFDGMSADPVGDASSERYKQNFKGRLDAGKTVLKTDSARMKRNVLEPLIFMVRWRRRGALSLRSGLAVGMNVFYDTAGEDIFDAARLGPLVTYLDAADAIIFVLDPLQIESVRRAVGSSARLPERFYDQGQMLHILGQELRAKRRQSADKRLATPLAVVLAKTDALDGLIPASSALRRPGPHDGVYDEADGRLVHDEVRAVLGGWTGGQELVNNVENSFSNHRFFALSALGASTVSKEDISPAGIQPLRVEDPMLWLMAQFGLIKVRKVRK